MQPSPGGVLRSYFVSVVFTSLVRVAFCRTRGTFMKSFSITLIFFVVHPHALTRLLLPFLFLAGKLVIYYLPGFEAFDLPRVQSLAFFHPARSIRIVTLRVIRSCSIARIYGRLPVDTTLCFPYPSQAGNIVSAMCQAFEFSQLQSNFS